MRLISSPAVKPRFAMRCGFVVTFGLAVLAGACGKSSSTTSPSTGATTSTKPTALSTTFTSTCGPVCHGATGSATPPGATASFVLAGNTSCAGSTCWTPMIRNGKSGTQMASYSTSTYSDADLQADFWYLTGSAWQ